MIADSILWAKCDGNRTARLVVVLMTLLPTLIDPLLTIAIVQPYRAALAAALWRHLGAVHFAKKFCASKSNVIGVVSVPRFDRVPTRIASAI